MNRGHNDLLEAAYSNLGYDTTPMDAMILVFALAAAVAMAWGWI
jgi:hypothetical protein